MATGRVNVGGGGAGLNIFTQMTMPKLNEGIWLKTDRKFRKIVNDTQFYFANEWDEKGIYPDIPGGFTSSGAVGLGVYIYMFGGGGDNSRRALRYNTIDKTYEMLSDIPFDFLNSAVTRVGTDIHLIDGRSGRVHYKYDTTNDSYTQLSNLPSSLQSEQANPFAETVGTDIYFGGSSGTLYWRMFYKYDTINDEYELLEELPAGFRDRASAVIGTDLYFIGIGGGAVDGGTSVYKYDTVERKFTKLANLPFTLHQGKAKSVGSDIYIFGSSVLPNACYKYDTVKDEYTKLQDIPLDFYRGDVVFVEDKFYLLGGTPNPTKMQVFTLTSKQYDENTFVLFRSNDKHGQYYTELVTPTQQVGGELFTRLATGFNDAFLFYDGELRRPPAYYGTGTGWVQFRG